MKDKTIHFVKAAFKDQFKQTLLANNLSADHYFKKVNLPTIDIDPESLLPVQPFWELINIVAVTEHIPDFGVQVAQTTPWHEVPSLAPLLNQSVSLKRLLEKFCDVATSQSSMVKFYLIETDSYFIFSYAGKPLYKKDIQMELYRITSMIQLVQLTAGRLWYPDNINLMMSKNTIVNANNFFNKSNITFSNEDSSISINKELLHLPVNITIPDKVSVCCSDTYDINTEFSNSIRTLLSVYIQDENCTIEIISEIVGISVRSLQRRLSEYDLKFNDLLNQAKYIHAKKQLSSTNIPITEITKSLGYSDPANFTRAFHRWAGISPSNFREIYTNTR